jgi:nucleotide-binding universal stress UspA family protein
MTTVLLPVTDHGRWTRAVADVVTNVEDDNSRAVVFYAFTEDEVESTSDNLGVDDSRPDVDTLASRKEGVTDAVDILTDGGLETDVRGAVVDEEDGEEILTVADDVDANRIYLYSRKRSPVGKAVLGSVVQRVLMNSEVPVVVTPASAV